ncbi:hypothetical protein C1707_15125 [Caulobacter flavus]|nr:hypothetical protein C1707_15125 [Caulobacter flavus]
MRRAVRSSLVEKRCRWWPWGSLRSHWAAPIAASMAISRTRVGVRPAERALPSQGRLLRARSRSLGEGPKGKSFLSREEWGGPGQRPPQGKKVERRGCGDGPVPVQIRPEEDAVGTPDADQLESPPRPPSPPFTGRENGSYTGAIDTLAAKLKTVEFRPVVDKPKRQEPDFRAYAGKADLDSAWKTVSADEEAPFGQAGRPVLQQRGQRRSGRSQRRPNPDLVAQQRPARGRGAGPGSPPLRQGGRGAGCPARLKL